MSSVYVLEDLDFVGFILKICPWAISKPMFLELQNITPEFSEKLIQFWTKAYALDFQVTSAKLLPMLDSFASRSQDHASVPLFSSLPYSITNLICSTWIEQGAVAPESLSLSASFLLDSTMEVCVKTEPKVIVKIMELYRDDFASPEFSTTPKGMVVNISHRVEN